MKSFLGTLIEAMNKLSQLKPTDVTTFVTGIQDMNMKKQKWEKEMDYLMKGQNVLKL